MITVAPEKNTSKKHAAHLIIDGKVYWELDFELLAPATWSVKYKFWNEDDGEITLLQRKLVTTSTAPKTLFMEALKLAGEAQERNDKEQEAERKLRVVE